VGGKRKRGSGSFNLPAARETIGGSVRDTSAREERGRRKNSCSNAGVCLDCVEERLNRPLRGEKDMFCIGNSLGRGWVLWWGGGGWGGGGGVVGGGGGFGGGWGAPRRVGNGGEG